MTDYSLLDITDSKKVGIDLYEEIVNRVKSTQSLIIKPYPHRLLMTQYQYDMLKPEYDDSYEKDVFLFKTPHNIMEVEVKQEF